ncbi:MAG TPA: winged helix DNA-binding domain-containing protein [Flavobacteriales bacterium]
MALDPKGNALRLHTQGLLKPRWNDPVEVVRALGAVQAQDYYGAKWAIGQRCDANDTAVEEAFNAGRIIRTHLLRPTWHFVVPEDLRWLLRLTGERVRKFNGTMYRKLGLEGTHFRKANKVLEKLLVGGKALDRQTISTALQEAKLDVSDFRLVHLLMDAELTGLICSGPRAGKQFTYMLLEERVPGVPERSNDEALIELMRRYFSTRGPATVNDFAWWSGLTVSEAKRGLLLLGKELERHGSNERWVMSGTDAPKPPTNAVHLVPNYDEYAIGFKDRSPFHDASSASRGRALRHILLHNGAVIGTWDTPGGKGLELSPFKPLGPAVHKAIAEQERRYRAFLQERVEKGLDRR